MNNLLTREAMQRARIFNRVWGPISQALAEAADADAGFDAGEFSAGWHDDYHQSMLEAALDRVAARLGVSGPQLCDEWEAWGHAQDEHWHRAMFNQHAEYSYRRLY